MSLSIRLALCVSFAVTALHPAPSIAADIHQLAGCWARYNVAADPALLPAVDTLILSAPRVESTPDGDALWVQMEGFRQRDRVIAIAMLVSDVAFLEGGSAPAHVHRYILVPAKGDPLEYVDREMGEPFLPRFGLFEGLLPLAPAGSPNPLFQLGEFLGRPLVLDRALPVGAKMLADFESATVLELNDRVLIGSSRAFRDDGTGRVVDYEESPPKVGDFRYVPLEKADYEEMIEAGFNLFRVPPDHLDHVTARPVFFMIQEGALALPDLFYRSNFRGGVMYMDEPDFRVSRLGSFEEIDDPDAAAQAVVDYTADMLHGPTMYGSGYLATMLADANWDLGPRVDLTELDIPSWIAFPGTGSYQMEAGARSIIDECRIDPADYSASVLEKLGVDFPAEPEPWIRFELGMATGSVERFGGEWGVSVFGQTNAAVADLLFPLAYERGAKYFWVWSSSESHHVPHERQLEIVRDFRDWVANESGDRPRDARPLAAIALPWGYNCDRTNFKGESGFLWWKTRIRLDDLNSSGVEYGEVLAAFYRTYLERIEAGDEVDLVYLRPGEDFPDAGYDAVYRVLPTGGVQTGTTSSPEAAPFASLPLNIWPNPSEAGTSLRFDVSRDAMTQVNVYDAAGRRVRAVLHETRLEKGGYSFWWNGRDDAGVRVSAGVYFARAVVGDTEGAKRIVLLR